MKNKQIVLRKLNTIGIAPDKSRLEIGNKGSNSWTPIPVDPETQKNANRIKNLKQKNWKKAIQSSRQKLIQCLKKQQRSSTNASAFISNVQAKPTELTTSGLSFPMQPIKLLEKRENLVSQYPVDFERVITIMKGQNVVQNWAKWKEPYNRKSGERYYFKGGMKSKYGESNRSTLPRVLSPLSVEGNTSDIHNFYSWDNEKDKPETPQDAHSISIDLPRVAQSTRNSNISLNEFKTATSQERESHVHGKHTAPQVGSGKMNLRNLYITDRDVLNSIREQILKNLRKILLSTNGMILRPPPDTETQYTYYVDKGNNHSIIRKVLSSREWWKSIKLSENEITDANFIWTQLRQTQYLDFMPYSQAVHESVSSKRQSCLANMKIPRHHVVRGQTKPINLHHHAFTAITKSSSFMTVSQFGIHDPLNAQVANKLILNSHLSNKKALYYNLHAYYTALGRDPFETMPLTFHIKKGVVDEEYFRFLEIFNKKKDQEDNVWIIKPGENTNRGHGVTVVNELPHIRSILSERHDPSINRTYIIQKYLTKPLLIHRRKFDIRIFTLVTSFNGVIQAYFYLDGYLRTSCKEFTLKKVTNRYVHLTNDAVQKYSEEYGKYESGNKMSYADFQKYIDTVMDASDRVNFVSEILPKIKRQVKDSIESTYLRLDPNRRLNTFEVFGYDFMIDSKWNPWIIECNTNPWLEFGSSVLVRLIPALIEHTFQLTIDVLFPDPGKKKRKPVAKNLDILPENRYELIFHELVDGKQLMDRLGENVSALNEKNEELDDLSDEEAYSDEEEDNNIGLIGN